MAVEIGAKDFVKKVAAVSQIAGAAGIDSDWLSKGNKFLDTFNTTLGSIEKILGNAVNIRATATKGGLPLFAQKDKVVDATFTQNKQEVTPAVKPPPPPPSPPLEVEDADGHILEANINKAIDEALQLAAPYEGKLKLVNAYTALTLALEHREKVVDFLMERLR